MLEVLPYSSASRDGVTFHNRMDKVAIVDMSKPWPRKEYHICKMMPGIRALFDMKLYGGDQDD